MYEQQYKLVTIAKELGINVSTLRRWLRDAGAKPKKDPNLDRMKRLAGIN